MRIQCFGNFEVFVDGKPVEFKRSKSKEILAYLVDRNGAAVKNKELAAILWEDQAYTRSMQSHLQTLIVEMLRALDAVGVKDIIIKQRGSFAVDIAKVYCDAYQFNYRDIKGVNAFHGEYMANYSWGEFRIGNLNNT